MSLSLDPLYLLPGVRGSALFTVDGVLIASAFEGVDGEALAALASQLVHQVDREAGGVGMGGFRHLTLRALYGTLFLVRLEELVLIVVAGAGQEAEDLWPRIEEAAAALPRMEIS